MARRAAQPIYDISWASPPPSRVRLRPWASTALRTSSSLAGMALAEVMRECDLVKSTLDRLIQRVYECGPTAAGTAVPPSRTASSGSTA